MALLDTTRGGNAIARGLLTRWRMSMALVGWLAVGLVVLADRLFYDHPVGWTVGLFTFLLLVSIWLRNPAAALTRPAIILSAVLLGLIYAMLEEPGGLEITLGLLCLGLLAMSVRVGWTTDLWTWLARWGSFTITGWAKLFGDAIRIRRVAIKRRSKKTILIGLLKWVVPTLLSMVFVTLFIAANPVLERWYVSAKDRLEGLWEEMRIEPARAFLWVFVLVWAWGLLRTRPRPRRVADFFFPNASRSDLDKLTTTLSKFTSVSLVVRCLILFNLVFAVQSVLDGIYLFGGKSLPQGMTYAEYAHRGAYPLVAASLLAGLFVLLAFRSGGEAERMSTARRLVYLWLAQNILLLFSSAWRLGLYVEMYSLSRWRIAAMIWMGVIAMGFVWLLARIETGRSNGWLVRVNLVTAFLVMYGCCFINFDRVIADFNVRHCREITGKGGPLDTAYLRWLGPESIPALRWYKGQKIEPQAALAASEAETKLRRNLVEQSSDWRGWTLRRQRLNEFVRQNP